MTTTSGASSFDLGDRPLEQVRQEELLPAVEIGQLDDREGTPVALRHPWKSQPRRSRKPGSRAAAATSAAAGSVSSQALMMLPATPQRTAEKRRVAPAPMHGARDDVGGRDREAVVRAQPERRAGRDLRREAVLGLHLVDALPERPDDPPAAGVRAGGDRQAGGDLHPVGM